MSKWWVYIVRCRDRSLYTGIALDVDRRLAEHRQGDRKGAKYLRGRGPLRLVLASAIGPKPLALRVEYRLKRLCKAEKEALIRRVRRMRRGSDLAFTPGRWHADAIRPSRKV